MLRAVIAIVLAVADTAQLLEQMGVQHLLRDTAQLLEQMGATSTSLPSQPRIATHAIPHPRLAAVATPARAAAAAQLLERPVPQAYGGPFDRRLGDHPKLADLRMCERQQGHRPGGMSLGLAEGSVESKEREAHPELKKWRDGNICVDPTCEACMLPVHKELGRIFVNARENATHIAARRAVTRPAFGKGVGGAAAPVLLFSTNYGALTNFANWGCSLRAVSDGGATLDATLARVVVVATEKTAADAAAAAGLAVFTPEMFGIGPKQFNADWIGRTRGAGATGVHGLTLSMAMNVVALSFLIDEGYDVLVQDTDVVWAESPIECVLCVSCCNVECCGESPLGVPLPPIEG